MDKREQNQIYLLLGMAAVVLGISIWAFVMGVRAGGADKVNEQSISGSTKTEKADREQISDTSEMDAIASTVLKKVSFDTELKKLDASVAESMITAASPDTKLQLYMGEGTCSDELLIVSVTAESKMSAEIDEVQKHLTDMQQSFQDYLPKEAQKINEAVILQSGNLLVACVTKDKDKAHKVIEDILKGQK